MQPRAFVVMPFGEKPGPQAGTTVNFNLVYEKLFEPSLRQAGYEVARADSEVSAGDIRTDMFFELVTADLVVADVTTMNANVFYELGVRHGVCPHGVFMVNGNLTPSRPFDIAPDRSFSYDASLFLMSEVAPTAVADPLAAQVQKQQELLTKRFKDALAVDRRAVGSPVYSHLPGLKPVNWDGIETSKAKYFTALRGDWLDCVRSAQADGHPGDILTLAMNAPTRMHESRILYEAAKALIDLCRYSAAERVLSDVIRLDPDHADAQVQLAMVLSHLGKTHSAERHLRQLSREYKDRPEAADLLGQVFRHLWHLSWKNEPTAGARRERAKEASQLGVSAIHRFLKAHRADPRAYFAGFNALMLTHLLYDIGPREHLMADPEVSELKTLTRYVARNQRQQAIDEGNHEQQFWATTTLAGILIMDQELERALEEIREACAIPAATSFQLQSFRDRLVLLAELEVKSEFVSPALTIVDQAMKVRNNRCVCERVFLWAGYPVDDEHGVRSPFRASCVDAVTNEVRAVLTEWGIKAGDLGICGGTTESDIIFAELCLEFGARIRILMRDPMGSELSEPLWPFKSVAWHERFRQLATPGERKELWFDSAHLGRPVEGSVNTDSVRFVSRRLNQWLINTAEMEAEPSMRVTDPAGPGGPPATTRLHGLFLWNGDRTVDDPDNLSFLIRRVNEFNGYQGLVKTIHPIHGAAVTA